MIPVAFNSCCFWRTASWWASSSWCSTLPSFLVIMPVVLSLNQLRNHGSVAAYMMAGYLLQPAKTRARHDQLLFTLDRFSMGSLVSTHGGRCWLGCINFRLCMLSTHGRWTCIWFCQSRCHPLGMSHYTTVFAWPATPRWHRYLSLCTRCFGLALLLCQPVCILSLQWMPDHINDTYLVLLTVIWSCDTTGA